MDYLTIHLLYRRVHKSDITNLIDIYSNTLANKVLDVLNFDSDIGTMPENETNETLVNVVITTEIITC